MQTFFKMTTSNILRWQPLPQPLGLWLTLPRFRGIPGLFFIKITATDVKEITYMPRVTLFCILVVVTPSGRLHFQKKKKINFKYITLWARVFLSGSFCIREFTRRHPRIWWWYLEENQLKLSEQRGLVIASGHHIVDG